MVSGSGNGGRAVGGVDGDVSIVPVGVSDMDCGHSVHLIRRPEGGTRRRVGDLVADFDSVNRFAGPVCHQHGCTTRKTVC